MRFRVSVLACAVACGLVAGCGAAGSSYTSNLSTLSTSSSLSAESIPPQSQFTTIECTVTELLPADTKGLPHQRFEVQETSPDDSMTLEVDNDMTYGEEVPNLQVGDNLTIRGVEYHDPGKDGIHWTHHANVAGDAGYIETADGTIYQ